MYHFIQNLTSESKGPSYINKWIPYAKNSEIIFDSYYNYSTKAENQPIKFWYELCREEMGKSPRIHLFIFISIRNLSENISNLKGILQTNGLPHLHTSIAQWIYLLMNEIEGIGQIKYEQIPWVSNWVLGYFLSLMVFLWKEEFPLLTI